MFIVKARTTPPQRRFVQEPSDDTFWQVIHRIADKYYLPIRRMVVGFWNRWRERIDYPRLFDSLLGNNIIMSTSVVERAWMDTENELITELQPVLTNIVEESFVATAQQKISVVFGGPTSQQVQDWVIRRTGEWITQIGQTEREAIRQTILDGMRKGSGPAAIARDVRQFIGLTRPQAETIARLRETMEQAGIRGNMIEAALEKRTRKMIRQRAMVIARNESIIASKEGNHQAWMEAAHRGEIDLSTARRFWVITPLDACEKCLPIPGMNPEGRRLDEPFATPIGALMSAHRHIQCRCVETVVL